MKPDAAANSFLPLAPATLHILLSLAGENLHGYGIMQEVARQSEGAVQARARVRFTTTCSG